MAPPKLFAGLYFWFHPSKTISRVNGIKAAASAKLGATIEMQPSMQTTHVLVARQTDTEGFWNFLDSQKLANNCLVLSSEWCSRCIDTSTLIDTAPYALQSPPKRLRSSPNTNASSRLENVPSNTESRGASRSETSNTAGRKRSATAPESVKLIKTPYMTNPAISTPNELHPVSAEAPVPSRAPISGTSLNAGPALPSPQGFVDASNQVLIDIFYDLMITRRLEGEDFSSQAYERALRALKSAATPVLSTSDALKVPGITPRMAALIQDIRNGKISRNLTRPGREKTETLQLFASVYGVGPYNARKLYDRGFRTLAEIKDQVDINGKVSIEHHSEFLERMSRDEVAQHFEAVKQLAAVIDLDIQAECMGSYRRGQPDCGDIDIILTKIDSDLRELKRLRKELIQLMFERGLAVHTFTKGSDRWLGATQVVGKWRRMDILLVPWKELGASFIYYTGNDVFNRKLRLKAKRIGMLLNHAGLFEIQATGEQKLLEGHNERRIFELLDEPWLDAIQRNLK